VWDAARASSGGGEQFSYAAAVAAALAVPAADECVNLGMQVHGGIGFTWEHDCHIYLRRATALGAVLDADEAAAEVTALTGAGVRRERSVDLPPEAELIRDEVRNFIASLDGLDEEARKLRLIDQGYAMPHWPKPYGRDAGAIEQLVIEQEFSAAGIKRPQYGITAWNILTIIQHGNQDQMDRWVRPALTGDEVWCQLFSEPEAGSDAAAVKTRAVKVEGGWIVNGQKVWTSGAQHCRWGFATVRTDPDAAKHAGVTMAVIDMEHPGVEVRPLRQITGGSDFNEVFFSDVFVPDADVVGEPNQGWTVARATLGNERVSIGGGAGGSIGIDVVALYREHGGGVPAAAERVGAYLAEEQALRLLNLRSAERAVAGGEPGPEGNITKLVLAEHGHATADLLAAPQRSQVALLLLVGAEGEDRGRGHAEADADLARVVVRGAGLVERLLDDRLHPARQPQATEALGEVHPRQPGVEAGVQEVEPLGRRRWVVGEEAVHPLPQLGLIHASAPWCGGRSRSWRGSSCAPRRARRRTAACGPRRRRWRARCPG
jgi:alkylation response protein AidB-like acyl-CoA dehydrogenase